jgi:hypothetical protein
VPRLTVTVADDDGRVLHEFTRGLAPRVSEIRRVVYAAIGWLQSWGDQATPEQLAMDARRAKARP